MSTTDPPVPFWHFQKGSTTAPGKSKPPPLPVNFHTCLYHWHHALWCHTNHECNSGQTHPAAYSWCISTEPPQIVKIPHRNSGLYTHWRTSTLCITYLLTHLVAPSITILLRPAYRSLGAEISKTQGNHFLHSTNRVSLKVGCLYLILLGSSRPYPWLFLGKLTLSWRLWWHWRWELPHTWRICKSMRWFIEGFDSSLGLSVILISPSRHSWHLCFCLQHSRTSSTRSWQPPTWTDLDRCWLYLVFRGLSHSIRTRNCLNEEHDCYNIPTISIEYSIIDSRFHIQQFRLQFQ